MRAASPVVGLAVTPDGTGDWMAEENGTVLSFGTAAVHGTLTGTLATSPVTSIAAMPVQTVSPLRYPSGSFGYDINWPQCAGPGSPETAALPGPPSYPSGTLNYTVAVVGVDGWAVGDDNPCLEAEVKWAASSVGTEGAPYELYMFLNSPSPSDTTDQQGPAGTCSAVAAAGQPACLAYNYGYNAAQAAVEYASSQGASSPVWWLDVENDLCGQYWSCNQALNSLTIQGALDYLHSLKITAGIYSTSVQWQGITGGYVPPGPQIPIWVAGAYWTSPPYPSSYGYYSPAALAPYCGAKYAFAGGDTWLLQETPGPERLSLRPGLRLLRPAVTPVSGAGHQARLAPGGPTRGRESAARRGSPGRRGSRWAASLNRTSHHLDPVKAHSVIDALSGKSRTRLPCEGRPRNRTREASMMPPWPDTTTSSPGCASARLYRASSALSRSSIQLSPPGESGRSGSSPGRQAPVALVELGSM